MQPPFTSRLPPLGYMSYPLQDVCKRATADGEADCTSFIHIHYAPARLMLSRDISRLGARTRGRRPEGLERGEVEITYSRQTEPKLLKIGSRRARPSKRASTGRANPPACPVSPAETADARGAVNRGNRDSRPGCTLEPRRRRPLLSNPSRPWYCGGRRRWRCRRSGFGSSARRAQRSYN